MITASIALSGTEISSPKPSCFHITSRHDPGTRRRVALQTLTGFNGCHASAVTIRKRLSPYCDYLNLAPFGSQSL